MTLVMIRIGGAQLIITEARQATTSGQGTTKKQPMHIVNTILPISEDSRSKHLRIIFRGPRHDGKETKQLFDFSHPKEYSRYQAN